MIREIVSAAGRCAVLPGALLSAVCVCGAVVEIGDVRTETKVTQTTDFDAVTAVQREYPQGLPEPIFWFDCTRTNGWEISAATRRVTKIPSLAGDRYLTVDQTGGHFTAWKATGATFVDSVDDLCGMPAIDFGEVCYGAAEAPGLVFDGRVLAEGAAPSNALERIGSVVAVFGSHESGGYLLGGGAGGIGFLRGGDSSRADGSPLGYANLLGKAPADKPFYTGMIRQDGLPNIIDRSTFNGAWQIVAFNAAAAESLFATGVGLNDCRATYFPHYAHGGGQKIAEMIIFSEKLADDDCRKLEAYLASKWMKRPPRGWNGNAALSHLRAFANSGATAADPFRLRFSADRGETVTVSRLDGGRAAAETPGIDKTGEGTLAIDDMSEYDGDIRLKCGTLAFNRRAVPQSLPPRMLAHFDASDPSSLVTVTENGTNFVTAWRGDAASLWKGERISLTPADGSAMAFVRPDAFGEGLPALDLGPLAAGSGAFSFTTNDSSSASLTFSGVSTIIAVVGAQEGGGHLANNYFARSAAEPAYGDSLVAENKQGSYFYLTEGCAFIDGVKRDMTRGYAHPGYQVVAVQVPGFNIATIGRNKTDASAVAGGMRLSEIAIYNRVLNETELRDASAYLMKKWMGRTAPGYAKSGRAVDVGTLEIHHPGTAVEVPEGALVRVGRLNASVPFEKRGGGELQIQSLRDGGDSVILKGGRVTAAFDADPRSACEMAEEPAFHLDSSCVGRMDISCEGGTNFVACWYDASMRNFAFQTNAAWRPFLRRDAGALLNGRPVVDFGPASTSGRYLNFCRDLNSIRGVFVVLGTQDDSGNSACLLGSSRHCPGVGPSVAINNLYDFARQNGKLFHEGYSSVAHVVKGDILTNGVACTAGVKFNRGYQLVEVHTLGGAHASALACDRVGQISQPRGGMRICEVLLYTRALTGRERTATRNYLRAKWFPDEELEPLPEDTQGELERPEGMTGRVAVIDAGDDIEVDAEADIAAGALTGAGAVAKTGAGTLSVCDIGGYSGTISVEEGTLELTGSEICGGQDGFVAEGRIFHADATAGLAVSTNALGAVTLEKWTSRHDPAWTAEPGVEGCFPTVRSFGAGGELPAVDMARDAGQCLRFRHNGELKGIDRIRSVFWVIGSQNGGGYLLGGGTNRTVAGTHYNFHRGYPQTTPYARTNVFNASRPLLSASADPAIRGEAGWWLNGVKIKPLQTGLSGGWDQVSMVMEDDCTAAEGFAFDGRSFDTASTMHNTLKPVIGGQRLAEVIVYDRVLSEAERLRNEAYLRRKWSVAFCSSGRSAATVELEPDAVLDCGGSVRRVTGLRGAGRVENGGISASSLVADGAAESWLTVDGIFAAADGMTVELGNLPAEPRAKIRILRATEFDGLENLKDAVFTGETAGAGCTVRLCVDAEGWLCVRIGPRGMLIRVK